jgi:ABC-2 type transport system ATP-binding protein
MVAGIAVTGVRKRFGAVEALAGIDLEVHPGEVVVVIGRNGAGKSTLLRILGTTVIADAGTAIVGGHDVVRDPIAARRSMGVVLGDERSWYWRLTGRHNLEFFAALHGMRRAEARRCVADVMAVTQIEHIADRRFDGYSSGQRARMSRARAVLAAPPVVLLDEPTRAVDPMVAADFRRVVADLAAHHGTAVLWVSHDLHEVVSVGTRVVRVHRGVVDAHADGPLDIGTVEHLVRSAEP